MQYSLILLGTIIHLILCSQYVASLRMSPSIQSRARRNTIEMVSTDRETPSQPHLNTRHNPMTEKFEVISFHHLEFYCGDATSTYKRFMSGLGLDLTAKSDQSTGNKAHASYLVESNDVKMIFTAPYRQASPEEFESRSIPSFSQDTACDFFDKHGLGVRAVAIEVGDVKEAFQVIMSNGGVEIMAPTTMNDEDGLGSLDIAEVSLYGDVVLRLINSKNFRGKGLPNFKMVNQDKPNIGHGKFGLYRFDHVVGNLHNLQATMDRVKELTGFHEFAEFDAEDVGTVDSGLNSVVMASNNQKVICRF